MSAPRVIRRLSFAEATAADAGDMLHREWLLTNGLGGYASGTISGVIARRYHGLLVAALPAPFGRVVMLNHLAEILQTPDGRRWHLGGHAEEDASGPPGLQEFRLEDGLPVWTYAAGGCVLEKRLLLLHGQNTLHVSYQLSSGGEGARLELRPSLQFRPHEEDVAKSLSRHYSLLIQSGRYDIAVPELPHPLRLHVPDEEARFTHEGGRQREIGYRTEEDRGYRSRGALWSPGFFDFALRPERTVTLIASTEEWSSILAVRPEEAGPAEQGRRGRLLEAVPPGLRAGPAAELVLAADQFIIAPTGRVEDVARARAEGDEVRTVIAGYHWFTDWGRDTMISLEGLTLTTGRPHEAAWILRTFAHYVRDGLIPNLFPEGQQDGLYHTADATLWFVHALSRYVALTGDRGTLQLLLPRVLEIIAHHTRGTRFGIAVDPADGLLRQGAEGYQLTWMDAKVDGWVVTPRRGKAVEINALWYHALRLAEGWVREERSAAESQPYAEQAEQARVSFNRRFWSADLGHLLDVVDGENGDDAACRPNQLLAISLPHAVLDEAHWPAVLAQVRTRLVTPVGLRSLAPGHPDYKARYFGDLRARDAAYHQGTVWGWLIGPFVDAWLKVHPDDQPGARQFLEGLVAHLDHGGVGSLSEIFDAEPPYTPRGCIAQAWSVAETLRCWAKTEA